MKPVSWPGQVQPDVFKASGDKWAIINGINGSAAGRKRLDLQKSLRWGINKEVTEWMSQTKQE